MKKHNIFYQRAFDDAAYRRQEIDNLRHGKQVIFALMICAALGLVAATLYIGLSSGRWLEMLALGSGLATFMALAWEFLSTRLAALEAFEERSNPEVRPGS